MTTQTRDPLTVRQWFLDGFAKASAGNDATRCRVGAELKFPLVNSDGTVVARDVVDRLWQWLIESEGWQAEFDGPTGRTIGATTPGPRNDTVASCETGYCKTEFSLAHAADLNELQQTMNSVLPALKRFAEAEGVHFLCYGTIPATPPGRDLLMKKERASLWDRAVPSNNRIPPERGDDVHLFTINAGSHVHVSVTAEDAVKAVNVLTGFAPAQVALTAHSPVWQGEIDKDYLCVNEKLWDFWVPARGRSAMPERPFADLADYIGVIEAMKPIYVKRDCGPVLLPGYESFRSYFDADEVQATDLDGNPMTITPEERDMALHNSCYWYNARVSRYYTVENRIFDQQPSDALLAPAAVTLGLTHALDEAWDFLQQYDWTTLRAAREETCRSGLAGSVNGLSLKEFARQMLKIAEQGLQTRDRDEAQHLEPLQKRLQEGRTPAEEVVRAVQKSGMKGLVALRAL